MSATGAKVADGERRTGRPAWHGFAGALLAYPLVVLAGCAPRGPEPVRLVLISPHRDEIREEVAAGFRDWFHTRNQDRTAAAQAAVQAWLQGPEPSRAAAVERALADLFQDWQPNQDLHWLDRAYDSWRGEPTREHGQALLAALEGWPNQAPEVEFVWQDVGGGTSQIFRFVTARFGASADGIGIDVLFGGGTDIYQRFAGDGLLEHLDLPPSLFHNRIPAQLNGLPLYDPKGYWFGPMLTSFGILYNREVLRRIGQDEPRHWADLGRPGLYGWVGTGDPRLTGSLHMVCEIILQGHGWDEGFRLLLRLGANTHGFIRDSGTLTRTVSNGEVAAAGNLDSNALSAVARDPAVIGFRLPEGETIINPDSLAVLKGAPRKELARAFVEYTLSDAGQRLFLLQPGQPGGPRRYALCRLSVVPKLYDEYPPAVRSVGAANPFRSGPSITYNGDLGTRRWDALNDLIGAVIIDAQADLSAAWRAVLQRPEAERDQRAAALFEPFCTQEELLVHARNIREDGPRVRTATLNRWGERARERYRAIRRAALEGGTVRP